MVKIDFSRKPDGILKGKSYWIVYFHPKDLHIDPQVRTVFREELILELAESIKLNGMLTDLLVNFESKTKKFILIAGERRVRAHTDHDIKTSMRAKVFKDLDEVESFILQVAENKHVRPSPIEEAQGFGDLWFRRKNSDALVAEMPTLRAFAKRLGESERKIRSAIRFVENLSPDISELVYAGSLQYSIAEQLARFPDQEEQKSLLKWIVEHGLPKRKAIRLIQNRAAELKGQKFMFGSVMDLQEPPKISMGRVVSGLANQFLGFVQGLITAIQIKLIEKAEIAPETIEKIQVALSMDDLFKLLSPSTIKTIERAYALNKTWEEIFREQKKGVVPSDPEDQAAEAVEEIFRS